MLADDEARCPKHTVRGAVFQVLKKAGRKGMTPKQILANLEVKGLHDWTNTRTPISTVLACCSSVRFPTTAFVCMCVCVCFGGGGGVESPSRFCLSAQGCPCFHSGCLGVWDAGCRLPNRWDTGVGGWFIRCICATVLRMTQAPCSSSNYNQCYAWPKPFASVQITTKKHRGA
jgi:HB1, ASXL, restriction endonuclease HTH domain